MRLSKRQNSDYSSCHCLPSAGLPPPRPCSSFAVQFWSLGMWIKWGFLAPPWPGLSHNFLVQSTSRMFLPCSCWGWSSLPSFPPIASRGLFLGYHGVRSRSFRPFFLAFGNLCGEICGRRRGCVKEGKQREVMGEKSDRSGKISTGNCAISWRGEW